MIKTYTLGELMDMDFSEEIAMRQAATALLWQLLPRCQSPIEKTFFKAFAHLCETSGLRPTLLRYLLDIHPQYELEGYRIDFAFPMTRVAVELDGHRNHSSHNDRTRDAQRDRMLLSCDWKTVRFTGAEIFHQAGTAVAELEGLLMPLAYAADSRREARPEFKFCPRDSDDPFPLCPASTKRLEELIGAPAKEGVS